MLKRALAVALWLACVTMLCSCGARPSESLTASAAAAQDGRAPEADTKILDAEAPCVPDYKPELRRAWDEFTGDGRYRLARAADMRYSDAARLRVKESFSLWQCGFTFAGELAALVVDTTRDGPARFGVVILKPFEKRGRAAGYRPHWLWRDRDLSNAALDRVSGYLFVHEFAGGAEYKSCEVKWRVRAGRYVCLPIS